MASERQLEYKILIWEIEQGQKSACVVFASDLWFKVTSNSAGVWACPAVRKGLLHSLLYLPPGSIVPHIEGFELYVATVGVLSEPNQLFPFFFPPPYLWNLQLSITIFSILPKHYPLLFTVHQLFLFFLILLCLLFLHTCFFPLNDLLQLWVWNNYLIFRIGSVCVYQNQNIHFTGGFHQQHRLLGQSCLSYKTQFVPCS